ncbi:MAG: prolyl oligopeptidase family serine peptidase, partial [Acidimicrobiales bacterium]
MSDRVSAGMQPEDIAALRQVADPRVSPDGKWVAFGVVSVDKEENRYASRIWLAASDGSERARPFTAGPDDGSARWSPDGSTLAVAVNQKDGTAQICLVPVARGGERVTIATWPSGVSELAWSPDGSELAFVARDPDPEIYGQAGEDRKSKDMPPRKITHLFSRLDSEGWVADRPNRVMVVDVDGSAPPRVFTKGPYQAEGLSWSPDGSRIAFASGRHSTWDLDMIVDLWAVATNGDSEPERLTEHEGAYAFPSWSPDGSRIAFLRFPTPLDEPRHFQLGVLEVAGGARTELTTDLDRNCFPYGASRSPQWAGDRLLFSVEDEGNVHVYSVPADGDGKPEPVTDGKLWVSGWDWADGTLAMAMSTPSTFPELVVRSFNAGVTGVQEQKLTDLTRPFRAKVAIGVPEEFVARSADGTEVPCWAIAPVGVEPGRRYPTLLNVHGGPFTSYGNRFFDEFQLQVGAGFGVLFCNPRGGSGYSEAWGRAVRWPEAEPDPGSGWGGVDYDDVMACVEEGCKRFGWIDPDRVGIVGGSYGGYMASWAIGHTDRFKAAVSERACNNLLALETNSDAATAFRTYVGRSHLEDPDAYLRQSPITYVKDMLTPVLMLHSEEDLRCPIGQAEELFVA